MVWGNKDLNGLRNEKKVVVFVRVHLFILSGIMVVSEVKN